MSPVERAMTLVQRAAQVAGWAFIIIGVGGFFATGASMETHPALAPRLLGIFPVNVLHNVVHLAFGLWGILASRTFGAARAYCRVSGIFYLLLAALGALAPNMFGLAPIGGNDVWLHAVLGAVLAAIGFAARGAPADVERRPEAPRTA
jgi:Domain of unknown function (DUF4383)